MISLCLAYKTNYPVVRAHHRQHETSPTTLTRSTNRPRSHESTRDINAAIDVNRAIVANDRDEQHQRSHHDQNNAEANEKPSSHHQRHGKPTSKATTRAIEPTLRARQTEPSLKINEPPTNTLITEPNKPKQPQESHDRGKTWPKRGVVQRMGTGDKRRDNVKRTDQRVPFWVGCYRTEGARSTRTEGTHLEGRRQRNNEGKQC